jgi:hypothetical protein
MRNKIRKLVAFLVAAGLGTCIVAAQSPSPAESPSRAKKHRTHRNTEAAAAPAETAASATASPAASSKFGLGDLSKPKSSATASPSAASAGTPALSSPPPATSGGEEFPFNLVWYSQAPGGFPFNPRWKWQVNHDGSPNPSICHYFSNGDGDPSYGDCTNQTHEENLPEDFNGWWCRVHNWFGEGFPGHLNWFTVTYEGQASWTDSNIDDDYNVALVSSGAPGVMEGRSDLHTEFDADEMDIEHFVGPWWQAIYSAAELGTKAAVKPIFAPKGSIFAIMTGMFGIDCEHDGCKSELHPVYAMAAHINDDPDNDGWAMFVRNNGDEGYCSSRLVPADFTSYTFHLPWRAWKTGVQIRSETIWGANFDGAHAPRVTWVPNGGVDVTFDLPPADQSPLIEGELHLRWTGRAPVAPVSPPQILAKPAPKAPKTDLFAAAVEKLQPEQRRELSRISVRTGQPPSRALRVLEVRPAERVKQLTPVAREFVRSGRLGSKATEMLAREQAKMRALCRFAGETSDATLREACSRLNQ